MAKVKHYNGTSPADLAREYGLEPYALAVFLGVPHWRDETAPIRADDIAWMRDVLDHTGRDGIYRLEASK